MNETTKQPQIQSIMPVKQDKKSGKYRIGRGKPIYKTKAAALRAQRGYYSQKKK